MASMPLKALFIVALAFVSCQVANATPPAGSPLWSNVSVTSPGYFFSSVQHLPGSDGDVLLLAPSACSEDPQSPKRPKCTASMRRMRPSTGAFTWDVPLPGVQTESDTWSLAVGRSSKDANSSLVALAWSTPSFGNTTIIAVDPTRGSQLWKFDGQLGAPGATTVSVRDGVLLMGGCTYGAAQAVAVSVSDGKILFNRTLEKGTGKPWFVFSTSLLSNAAGRVLALVGTVGTGEGLQVSAPGTLFAIDVEADTVIWRTKNVTTKTLFTTSEVVVAIEDAREIYGSQTNIVMISGRSLKDGKRVWQRTQKGGAVDSLRRACDVDCSVPCELVAAGVFGAINATTGQTIYNTSTQPGVVALANGIDYWVKHSDQKDHVIASACGNQTDVLWSAPLPMGDDGSESSAPWNEIVVVTPQTTSETGVSPQAVVLLGGHDAGHCFRGSCSAMHSALAAIHAPSGIVPPPLPPPPAPAPTPPQPSKCQDQMMTGCAVARAASTDMCLLCCGEHADKFKKVGCKDKDFTGFCHTTTCNPQAQPPQICPDGTTCPTCGKATCNCPSPKPPTPAPSVRISVV